MGINFADLFWASVACTVVLVGTVAGVAYNNRDLRIEVRVGRVTMVDAGVSE